MISKFASGLRCRIAGMMMPWYIDYDIDYDLQHDIIIGFAMIVSFARIRWLHPHPAVESLHPLQPLKPWTA
jgi:hypothetical protein